MTVVYPFTLDKDVLLTYMRSLDESAKEPPVVDCDSVIRLSFSPQDIANTESACGTILKHLRIICKVVSTGGPLTVDGETDDALTETGDQAATPGSVFAIPFGGPVIGNSSQDEYRNSIIFETHLYGFFASHREAVDTMNAELLSSQEVLRRINADHAFILTSDIESLSTYLKGGKAGKVKEHHAARESRAMHMTDASGADNTTTTNNNNGMEPPAAVISDADLVALPAAHRPSPAVKDSYAKFIQAAVFLLHWLSAVQMILSGQGEVPKAGTYPVTDQETSTTSLMTSGGPPTTTTASGAPSETNTSSTPSGGKRRTVRVKRFEVHDVQQIYDLLFDQAKCFFLPEYTQYDARLQRRLLHPSYFYALRDLISEYSDEIVRLENIASRKVSLASHSYSVLSPYDVYQRGAFRTFNDHSAQLVFRPPLNQFYFIRACLQVYLSACLNEDDLTSEEYYRHVYESCVADAKDMGHAIHHLLRPQPQPPGDHDDARYTTDEHASATEEQHGKQTSAFENYWDVRERVRSLKADLERDIRRKDRTHRTRELSAVVRGERTAVGKAADREKQMLAQAAGKNVSLWKSALSSLQAIAMVATCKAEVDLNALDAMLSGDTDSEGFPMTTTSPFREGKVMILENVKRLWKVIEIQATQLEESYPNVFFRDEKGKWANRVDSVLQKAESVSVVFSRGT